MEELNPVIDYINQRELVLEAGHLENKERTIFYVIQNRINKAIDRDNPEYKKLAELIKESEISIQELHDDLSRAAYGNYGEMIIIDDYKFSQLLTQLGQTELTENQNFIAYLIYLARGALSVINCNNLIAGQKLLIFESIMYISVCTLNRYLVATNELPVIEGVEVKFDRKRRSSKFN